MIVTDKQIYQVKFLAPNSNGSISSVAVVASNLSFGIARDIFKDSDIEFDRIVNIGEVAQSYITDEIEVKCTDKTKPKKAKDKE
jgi:hypothetical protein